MTSLPLPHRRIARWTRGHAPGPWLVLAGLIVGGASLVPPIYLVVRALESAGSAVDVLTAASTRSLLLRSLLFAAAVTAGATAIALPMAWLVERSDLAGRRVIGILAALPLAVPSYVGALTFISAFGPRGLVQGWLEPLGVERLPSIYGFFGATLALTMFTYPYLFLTLRPALATLDPRLEEMSRTFGYGRWFTFTRIVLPQVRPALFSGGLLVALYALSDFGTPALMRFDSFTRVIFIRYQSAFDRGNAATLALLLAVLALAVVAAEVFGRSRRRADGVRDAGRPPVPVALGRWRWPAYAFVAAIVGLALVLPIAVLLHWIQRGIAAGVAFRGMGDVILDSVLVAALAAAIAAAAALPVAILGVRHRGHWFSRGVEVLSYTGYALPGLVVGLALVFTAIRVSWLYQSVTILVLAYVMLFLPQATNATRVALLRVRPSMEEAARGLGRRPGGVLRTITIPLAGRGVLAGAALVFLTTIKELPATLILAPPGFQTLATRVWSASSDVRYAEAALPALMLVGISLVALVVLNYGSRR